MTQLPPDETLALPAAQLFEPGRFSAMKSAIIAAIVAAVISAGAATATTTYISGKQIKPHSISASRLTPAAIKALRGKRGPRGYSGYNGINGVNGKDGGFDPSKVHTVFSPMVSIPSGSYYQFTVNCPAGETPLSGGVWGNLFGSVAEVQTYSALGKVTATVRNDDVITVSGQASAICAAR
jgi:hypothetical protein